MQVTNDTEFKQALDQLSTPQQRAVAALFVEHVLSLCNDERVERAASIASNLNASEDELAMALKSARAATFDSHTRCGSEGDWTEQAGYFVARAAAAAVAPATQTHGGPAWQAAMSSRMAQTCKWIDIAQASACGEESEEQYRILDDFLNTQAG